MHEAGWVCEPRSRGDYVSQMGKVLHDLCQPLTTLQCRLEMATLAGTDQDYREAVDLGLAECARLAEAVGSMREIVRAAVQDAEVGEIGAGR
jgi:signal transduction histidine kinase